MIMIATENCNRLLSKLLELHPKKKKETPTLKIGGSIKIYDMKHNVFYHTIPNMRSSTNNSSQM